MESEDKDKEFWENFPWENSDHQAKWLFTRANENRGLFILKLEPHAQVGMHTHPWPHHGIVIGGELIITCKGEQRSSRVGEIYQIDGGEEHGGRPGSDGCVLLELRKQT